MTRFFISFGLPSPILMPEKKNFTERCGSGLAVLKSKFPKFLRPYLNKSNFIILLVVLFFLIQYIQISSMTGGFSSLTLRGSSLVDEVGKLNQITETIGQDLNEVRSFLVMPTRKYSDADSGETVGGNDSNQDELQLALFKYINYIGEQEKLGQKLYGGISNLNTLYTDKDFTSYLSVNKLTLSTLSESAKDWHLSILDEKNETVVYLFLDKSTGDINIQNVSEKTLADVLESETFAGHIKSYLEQNLANILSSLKQFTEKKSYILSSLENEAVKQIFSLKKLTVSIEPVDKDFKLYYQIKNESKEVVAEIILDKKDFSIQLKDVREGEKVAVKVTDLASAIPPFLENLDTIPEVQKKVIEAKAKLTSTFDDKGFKLLLDKLNLSISKEAREDEYRYYYDIYTVLTGKTKLLGSVVVEKATGMVNVVDPNGTNTTNILFFDPGLKKKTLELPKDIPSSSDLPKKSEKSFNILLGGKNGSLVDTMVFAHLNEDDQTADLISIPRDLYYNGRKLNSYPYLYGMDEFRDVVEKITGYRFDKYVVIDMYAFIDVIDLIGGVDVHLDEALVDPTYKTLDNGVWGTLSYEAGDYHFNGREALRVARSRHTSSDFSRAERQQKIIEAIQSKAKNLGFGDATTIYSILKTVLAKTETDVSLTDAVRYYFKYQNFTINSNHVMSSGNILYVPPYTTKEQCETLIKDAEAKSQPKPDCENALDAYTLLPKDDNWDLIKWYFRENFDGVGVDY